MNNLFNLTFSLHKYSKPILLEYKNNKMTKQKKILIAVLGGVAVLAVIFALVYSRSSKSVAVDVNANANTTQKGPVQITATQAVVQSIPSYIEGTGSFVADETTDVAPRVSGQVVSTFVEVGDFVRQGQVIAQLDDKDARLRLEQAKSSEKQAEVAVKQAAARLGISANGKFDRDECAGSSVGLSKLSRTCAGRETCGG